MVITQNSQRVSQTEGEVSQPRSDTMEVDEGVDIEESGDASLHDGDTTLHPRSRAEELNDRTGCSTVSNAGESLVEGRNTPRRNTRDVTPRPQSRGREEEEFDPWSVTQCKWDNGVNLEVITPQVNELEERKEYEERKNLFMKLAPDTVAHTKRASKAAQEASDAAMQLASNTKKTAETAKRAAKEAEESAAELQQLITQISPQERDLNK
jgi:hypothetical protein